MFIGTRGLRSVDVGMNALAIEEQVLHLGVHYYRRVGSGWKMCSIDQCTKILDQYFYLLLKVVVLRQSSQCDFCRSF